MKILYYSSHPNLNLSSPSGYGTHMREMIAAFEAEGHEVRTVIMGGTNISTSNLKIKRRSLFKSVVASFVPKFLWESAKDYKLLQFDRFAKYILEKEIAAFNPDFIYERATYLQTSGVTAAKENNIQHVLEVNSPYVEERKELQGVSYFLKRGAEAEKKQLEYTDHIVVVSTALQEYFIKQHHIKPLKFVVTPNAINTKLLDFNKDKTLQLKDKLNINGKTTIGFVGSIFPWHGVDVLISSFSRLVKEDGIEAHLLIVGDGEILPQLKEIATGTGIANKITFTGNVPHSEVFNYIDLMDICVSPKSHWYGSPVKIFEYGAMGKAIIAPDNVPVRDVMENNKTGLLTKQTPDSLYLALKLYLQNNELRKKYAMAFQQKVLSEHTWRHNALTVLKAVL